MAAYSLANTAMDEDRSDRLEDIENQVAKNSATIDLILSTEQARWEKSQGKFHAVYTRLNGVATNESRTFESLKNLRAVVAEIKAKEDLRLGYFQQDLQTQKNKAGSIEQQTKKIEKESIKKNSTILIAIALLFALYMKEDIQAGKIIDLIFTLLAASGITIYGIHSNGKED